MAYQKVDKIIIHIYKMHSIKSPDTESSKSGSRQQLKKSHGAERLGLAITDRHFQSSKGNSKHPH
ncbi:unnamed protein product [Ceutorhynchus assimilis]|uniref:Uncharacterized protein n=1 Tax=Ceutorhynchus assimilis TaxID=467358 RepID=A0A9N9MP39_9CUCU|nr:unnamed protein product [Ceutorhynchus assimilis]